ncbi:MULTISPECIES: acyl-CoA dehydratase activase [unclassified Candidatus Frackibacter]|uniref:acyl-CoA dehydratase activase n=1 Tax=unclassified Candidatus Frackibacter TaxID=2648818 RepID=UPI0007936FF8|nr:MULTISPECIES: acyl-CoA dehydratase activase [unclassified Candidatus Frackibacter]KXS43680.1 MAG: CoA-substrate-specific enzyme activase [Candidatus Frackibacter sp. T328-2]SDC01643.1 CoA-substrate-specific enzyme activase, putative [Candidatus Frackibacter sp. WG11]SEM32867.1 CoA-substrate-specific enzyme activase, putative [Candidatus Frackibacter sp. WG12]SFL37839.1 CoA-substrate-specific enzyme activase, putative [Candidatus Frackibacter sp. WG13]
MKGYLGIDVGSVSTNLVLLNDNYQVLEKLYLRTQGRPIDTIQIGLKKLGEKIGDIQIKGVGTTGSARNLAGVIVGADVIKNEITAHAVAASNVVPGVRTVLEIGGQDSKIIILREGVVVDFAMNTVCAAGTGSFLDQQASRLSIPIEEFGELALQANSPVRIAGRCSVFAESDMIHKQQLGHCTEDIIAGLCEALVRNYLNNVGQGKEILEPILFQGGVAANKGIKAAFSEELDAKINVPKHHNVMGALGSAILAKEEMRQKKKTSFKGFDVSEFSYNVSSFECDSCPNSCEIINIYQDEELVARWGFKCPKWEAV